MSRRRRALAALTTSLLSVGALVAPAAARAEWPAGVEPAADTTVPPADGVDQLPDGPPVVQDDDAVVDSWALTPEGADTSNRTDLSYAGAPGDTIDDVVTLWNLGNRQLTFDLYATDAFNTDSGDFSLLPGGDAPAGVGTWVTFPQAVITVPPLTKVSLPITITIPDDARPGDHVGGVLAANTATDVDDEGTAINVERRTGSRLYVRVDGPIRTEVAIEDPTIDFRSSANPFGGDATVTFRIANRGNVRVDGSYDVEVSGPLGLGAQAAPTETFPELLPGEGVEMTVEFDGVPALVVANADVSVTPGGGDTARAASTSTSTFAPPITLLLVLLLIALALFAWLRIRSHRRRLDGGEPDVEVAVGFLRESEPV